MPRQNQAQPHPLFHCYLAHGGHREGPSPNTPCVQVPGTDDNGSPDRRYLWEAAGREIESVTLTDKANHFANNHNAKGPLGFSLEQERDREADD